MNKRGHTLYREFKKNLRPSVRMLQGAGLATALMSLSFFSLGESNSGDYRWMILPCIFVPAAGALGGLLFHLLQPMREKGGNIEILSIIFSVAIYILLLGFAFILGMNGPD